MEIERKFLLKNSDILNILYKNSITIYKSNITQFYTEISKLNEIRYRQKDEIYYLTSKSSSRNTSEFDGLERDELEVIVSKNEYELAKKKRVSNFIKKERFNFILDKNECFFDIYQDSLKGLFTLEVEFNSKSEALNFKIPEIFKSLEILEVTKDEKYKNKFLAIYGLPDTNGEINPSYKDAYHGFRELLAQIYISIKNRKKSYEKTKNPEDLHQFRVGLRKSRSLLKSAKKLYNAEILARISDGLKNIAKSTNLKRDFDVFIEYLKGVDGSAKVIKSLNFVGDNQSKNIDEYLNSKESELFWIDYENFLADESGFFKENEVMLKKFVALIIRDEIVKIEKALTKLNFESTNDEFHRVRIELKRLRYLLESFKEMFGLGVVDKFYKELRNAQEFFGNLQDMDAWCDIIDMYDKGENREFLLDRKGEISLEMFKVRGEILSQKALFLKRSRRVSRVLKVYY